MRKSFTMVEVLIVTAIMAVLGAAISLSMVHMNSFFRSEEALSKLQAESRKIKRYLSNELRTTDRAQIVITKNSPFAGTDTIQFPVPRSDIATSWDPADLWDADLVTLAIVQNGADNILTRTQAGVAQTYTKNVSSIRFIDSTQDATLALNELRVIITFNITDKNNRSYVRAETSIINMRN